MERSDGNGEEEAARREVTEWWGWLLGTERHGKGNPGMSSGGW